MDGVNNELVRLTFVGLDVLVVLADAGDCTLIVLECIGICV